MPSVSHHNQDSPELLSPRYIPAGVGEMAAAEPHPGQREDLGI